MPETQPQMHQISVAQHTSFSSIQMWTIPSSSTRPLVKGGFQMDFEILLKPSEKNSIELWRAFSPLSRDVEGLNTDTERLKEKKPTHRVINGIQRKKPITAQTMIKTTHITPRIAEMRAAAGLYLFRDIESSYPEPK